VNRANEVELRHSLLSLPALCIDRDFRRPTFQTLCPVALYAVISCPRGMTLSRGMIVTFRPDIV